MKKRDIILDFTTLLDVTLILLFFFILFSNFQVTDAKEAAGQKMQEAQNLYSEGQALQEQVKEELEHIRESESRYGENVEGILEFNNGLNLKLILEVADEDSWQVNVFKGQDSVGSIDCDSDITKGLFKLLENAGYTTKDTIICDYIYDASQPGSLVAYRVMTEVIKEVKQEYRYLYYSETDISILED